MIDTSKLLPRASKGSSFSNESIKNIGIIKKNVIEIDSLLKERLVLRKVREGILKQQEERDRRFSRESSLEGRNRKDKDSDYDIGDPLKPKRKSGTGGLIGGIVSTVFKSVGLFAFSRLGFLLKTGKLLKLLLNPKVLVIAGTLSLLSNVISSTFNIGKDVDDKDLNAVRGNKIKNTFESFVDSLEILASAMLAGAIVNFGTRRLKASRTELQQDSLLKGRLFRFAEKERIKRDKRARADAEADIKADQEKGRAEARRAAKKQREIDEEIAETASRQSRVTRASKKQVGGQIVPRTSRTATGVIDKGRGMSGIMKRNSFLVDPSEGFEVRSKLTKDGVERFFLGDSNIRLSEIDVGGQTLFEAKKTPALKRRIAAQFGIDPKDFDFEDVFDTFELRSNLGRKAGRDAGIDALLDQVNMRDTQGFSTRQQADMAKFLDQTIFGDKITRANVRAQEKAANNFASRTGTRRRGSGVVSRGRVGSRQFLRPDGSSTDDAYRSAIKNMKPRKVTAAAVTGVSQKGGRKFISESVGVIPFIGDLIGLLLDIFVFGEPPGRAAFMAVGGALGGFLGGLLGSIGGPPGMIIAGILGGIGGDILGGLLYDFLFRDGMENPFSRLPKAGIKNIIKQSGLMTGGFAKYGVYKLGEAGTEFVFDVTNNIPYNPKENVKPLGIYGKSKAKGEEYVLKLKNKK